jgi:exodeoxyribonuclease V alpha subunit
LVVLPEGIEHPLLTRELLYTGITRAKKEIVIQGTRETILHTADNCIKRISGIANRIMQEA